MRPVVVWWSCGVGVGYTSRFATFIETLIKACLSFIGQAWIVYYKPNSKVVTIG